MKYKQKQPEFRSEGCDCWVVNLTDRDLTPNQQEVLRTGLDLAPVSTKFKNQDTITSVEEAARRLPKDDADDLCSRVCRILRSPWLAKDNMTKDDLKALKELRNLEDKVIIPADWGNATVMMKRSDYDEKMGGMLDDTTAYRKLQKGPTATQEARIVRKLLQLHKNGEITKNRIRPSGSCPPPRYMEYPKYISRRSHLGP